jgi:hypothetical protein
MLWFEINSIDAGNYSAKYRILSPTAAIFNKLENPGQNFTAVNFRLETKFFSFTP